MRARSGKLNVADAPQRHAIVFQLGNLDEDATGKKTNPES